MSTHTTTSNLDSSAAEFVPEGNPNHARARREALAKMKEVIDPFFNGEKTFQQQLDQLFKMASLESEVDPPQVIGYTLGRSTLESAQRCTSGFRLFKELRAQLPTMAGQSLEYGLFTAVHEITHEVANENSLKEFQHQTNPCSVATSTDRCEEAGDAPSQANGSDKNNPFVLVKYLNLLITRLNLPDSPSECTCIPPPQPCIDLCQFVETVCRMQLTCSKVPLSRHSHDSSSNDVAFDPTVITRRDWTSLLYLLVDSFSHSLSFFNCFLTSLNQRVLGGAWHHTGSLEERAKVRQNVAEPGQNSDFDCGSCLSSRINRILGCMRELLLEERVPLKMIRSAILDTLMIASEMTAVNNMSYRSWSAETYEMPVPESGSTESEGDEFDEYFQKFLVETHQIPPS